jgi:hypothetical protein
MWRLLFLCATTVAAVKSAGSQVGTCTAGEACDDTGSPAAAAGSRAAPSGRVCARCLELLLRPAPPPGAAAAVSCFENCSHSGSGSEGGEGLCADDEAELAVSIGDVGSGAWDASKPRWAQLRPTLLGPQLGLQRWAGRDRPLETARQIRPLVTLLGYDRLGVCVQPQPAVPWHAPRFDSPAAVQLSRSPTTDTAQGSPI